MRHPLYLANFLIALGMALFSRTWFLPIIVSLATLLYYERIAAREEEFLDARFGAAFRRWAELVPAAVPSLKAWCRAGSGRSTGAVRSTGSSTRSARWRWPSSLLDMMEDYAAKGQLELDPVWATVAAAGRRCSSS